MSLSIGSWITMLCYGLVLYSGYANGHALGVSHLSTAGICRVIHRLSTGISYSDLEIPPCAITLKTLEILL